MTADPAAPHETSGTPLTDTPAPGTVPGGPAAWRTRDDLASAGRTATGLLLVSADAGSVVPADPDALTAAYAAALEAAGVGGRDRVVAALSGDGELAGAQWARAAAEVAAAGASVGPRGRLRLHHALESLAATTLVITPTGAMDLLARLHLEFLLDPLDLGLRHVVLTGEIASRGTMSHLATEFGARVTEVYSSPFTAAPLGLRSSEAEPLTLLTPGSVALACLDKDELITPPYAGGPAELVVAGARPGEVVRTGQVARTTGGDAIPAPAHTVGDHVLVRGVWVSLNRIGRALGRIDGVSGWELGVSRQGTLDAAVLTVTFGRESLVGNPMWKARVQQALKALTPVTVAVEIADHVSETAGPGVVKDTRGHHLGRDRTAVPR